MPNDSGSDTPPSTAPSSPTSPTSTNALIDCEKGYDPNNHRLEYNEKGLHQGIGHYTFDVEKFVL